MEPRIEYAKVAPGAMTAMLGPGNLRSPLRVRAFSD
jgi:hypothetical protein